MSATCTLFLGIHQDEQLLRELLLISRDVYHLFVNDHELEVIDYFGMSYIGKRVGQMTDSNALVLLEENVLSLLKRLLPDQALSLQLLAVPA